MNGLCILAKNTDGRSDTDLHSTPLVPCLGSPTFEGEREGSKEQKERASACESRGIDGQEREHASEQQQQQQMSHQTPRGTQEACEQPVISSSTTGKKRDRHPNVPVCVCECVCLSDARPRGVPSRGACGAFPCVPRPSRACHTGIVRVGESEFI